MSEKEPKTPLSKYEKPAADAPSGSSEATNPSGANPHTMGMLCHLLGLGWYLVPSFGNIIGPLILWLIKKDEDAFADACGKEALNFQISVTIYAAVSALLLLVAIGAILLPAIIIFQLVCVIIASVRASEGELYRYPLTIRFLK